MRSHIKKSEPFSQAPLLFCHHGKIVVPEILVEKISGSANLYSTIWRYHLSSKINNSFSSFCPAGREKFQDGASQSKLVPLNLPVQNSRFFEITLTYTYSRKNRRAGANGKYGKQDGADIERNKMSFDSCRIINSVSGTKFPVSGKARVFAGFPEAKKDYIRPDTGKQPGPLLWVNQDASVSHRTRDPMDRSMTSHEKPMISFKKNSPAEGFFSNQGPEMIFLFSSGMHSASKGEQF